MARYTGPSCKLCRREGKKLFLKGDRCLSEKCAVSKRSGAPGPHAQARKTVKEYGLQHREKMTARRYYGVLENQFKSYYLKADKQEGVAGANLLSLLERRLDNVVYRLGLASSRKEARQLIRHAHFTLNGKKVDVPSIILKVGDVIALKDKSRSSDKFKALAEEMQAVITPKWLEVDRDNFTCKVIAIPQRDDIDFPFEEQLIIELYSK